MIKISSYTFMELGQGRFQILMGFRDSVYTVLKQKDIVLFTLFESDKQSVLEYAF